MQRRAFSVTESEIVAELTTVAAPEWRPPVNAVTALSSDDFDEFVEAQKASPILFYTKKCDCDKVESTCSAILGERILT